VEYGLKMIFSEEKKIRENRIDERKKRERGGTTETERGEEKGRDRVRPTKRALIQLWDHS